MLSVESDSIFYYPKGKKKEAEQAKRKFLSFEGDHLTLLNIYKSWISNSNSKDWCFQNFINGRSIQKAKNIRDQLRQYLASLKLPILSCFNDIDPIKKSFVSGISGYKMYKNCLIL
jgi:HrpA-like RNA helicase